MRQNFLPLDSPFKVVYKNCKLNDKRKYLRVRKNLKPYFILDQKDSKKLKSLDCSPDLDMGPNFKVIFFYSYPMPKLSTVKKLLKNIVKQKSSFWLTFKI